MSTPKGTVLVVDDDSSARVVMQTLLEADFNVHVVGGYQEAVAWLEQHPVEVLVTDYVMPEHCGLELLVYLAKKQPMAVGILLTGQPNAPAIQSMRQRATFLTVSKTYESSLILDRIKNALVVARLRQSRDRLTKSGILARPDET